MRVVCDTGTDASGQQVRSEMCGIVPGTGTHTIKNNKIFRK